MNALNKNPLYRSMLVRPNKELVIFLDDLEKAIKTEQYREDNLRYHLRIQGISTVKHVEKEDYLSLLPQAMKDDYPKTNLRIRLKGATRIATFNLGGNIHYSLRVYRYEYLDLTYCKQTNRLHVCLFSSGDDHRKTRYFITPN